MSHGHQFNLHCSRWNVLLFTLVPEEETGVCLLPAQSRTLTKSGTGILVWPDSGTQYLEPTMERQAPSPSFFPRTVLMAPSLVKGGVRAREIKLFLQLEQKLNCINGLALCI